MAKKLFSNQACITTFESALDFAERNPGGITYVATNILEYPDGFDDSTFQDSAKDYCWAVMMNGITQNLTVRLDIETKQLVVEDGKRRLMAARRLHIDVLPVSLNITQGELKGLVSDVSRQAKSPLAKAVWFKKVMETENLTQRALAERLGCTEACVSTTLSLLRLTPEIQAKVIHDNDFTLTDLMNIARLDPSLQGKAFEALKSAKNISTQDKSSHKKRTAPKSCAEAITSLKKKLLKLEKEEELKAALKELQNLIDDLKGTSMEGSPTI